MSEIAAIIGAAGTVLTTIGGGCWTVYALINKKVVGVETALKACEDKHGEANAALFKQGVLMRLGFDEFQRVAPGNIILNRVQAELQQLYPADSSDLNVPADVRALMKRLNGITW